MSPRKKGSSKAPTNAAPKIPKPPSALQVVQKEIMELKPKLAELKGTEEYAPVYKRFMWLIEERDRLKNV